MGGRARAMFVDNCELEMPVVAKETEADVHEEAWDGMQVLWKYCEYD